MSDRIRELREAIDESIFVDIALPIDLRRHQSAMVATLKKAARRDLALRESVEDGSAYARAMDAFRERNGIADAVDAALKVEP